MSLNMVYIAFRNSIHAVQHISAILQDVHACFLSNMDLAIVAVQ